MAARWKLVQSFIREATEDANFAPVADVATVYAKLRTIQRGAYTTATADGGVVQVSSKIGETEFSFSIPEGISPAEIMETAETALQIIAGCASVDAVRALLVRRKTTYSSMRRFSLL